MYWKYVCALHEPVLSLSLSLSTPSAISAFSATPQRHHRATTSRRHPGLPSCASSTGPGSISTLSQTTIATQTKNSIITKAKNQPPPNLEQVRSKQAKQASMGWLKPNPTSELAYRLSPNNHDRNHKQKPYIDAKKISHKHPSESAQHLERIDSHTNPQPQPQPLLSYPFQNPHLADIDLPFIPSTVVLKAQQDLHRIWIVIDNVVFDATDFLHEHPGGNTVIESFAGQDCSWQFWRFHARHHMGDFGGALRVGRTVGVRNKFVERPRFVGLRKLDVWD